MARLFLTPREQNLISDLTKEVIKDVNGQCINYYSVSEVKTDTHSVYNEALQKIFDNPISIDALVDVSFQSDTSIGIFGIDQQYKIEIFLHYRDMVEKGINVSLGDFFSYGEIFYEITESQIIKSIYGQAEHYTGIKLIGTKAREGQIEAMLHGPTNIKYTDSDAVQTEFVQQRGYAENSVGKTGDVRDLVKNGVLDPPLTGPKEISDKGTTGGSEHKSSFYDE